MIFIPGAHWIPPDFSCGLPRTCLGTVCRSHWGLQHRLWVARPFLLSLDLGSSSQRCTQATSPELR